MISAPSRLAVLTGLVAVLAATTGTATAATAHAAGARPGPRAPISGHTLAAATLAAHRHAAGATQQVQLALTPRDRTGLAALATAHTLSRGARLARLDAALPGSARREQVGAVLRRLGLTVTGSSPLTLTASGPAATIASLFGTEQAPGLPTAQALPRVPASLRGLVTVAYGGDDIRPAELPLAADTTPSHAALTVAQTRSLYGTTATTATPSSSGPIVATLQFTTSTVVTQAIADSDSYAADNDLYATNGYQPSSNITQVPVTVSCPQQPPAGDDDGVEVSLDTETLLTVAPQLRQRVYQAPNCGNAQDDAIAQIISDVQGGQPIVALSTSWGTCEEAEYGSTTADVDAVNALLAAGVTMFAATGDSGSNDCGNNTPSDTVDTPASIPGVVAVGGTTGNSSSALTVWDDDATDASGGGFSCGYFARPSYQAGVARAASYPRNLLYGCPAGSSERMLPDIAENGGNGIEAVVSATGSDGCSSCTARVYGTSFAAPLAAGGFAQTLLNDGQTTGLGDIHRYLYADRGFTDIRAGSNGDYAATTGYDVASGLGAPNWSSVLTSARDVDDVSVTSGGVVTISRAYADGGWQTGSGPVATGLTVNDPSQWRFVLAPFGSDGASDLWAVRLTGDASGHVVVYALSQASSYTTRLVARVTPLAATAQPAQWQVRINPFGGDKGSDLFLVRASGTSTVEVFGVSQASSYHSIVAERATPLAAATSGWTYEVAGANGDLYAVDDATAHVEIYVLPESVSYHSVSLHRATGYPGASTSPSTQLFAVADLNRDGTPDLAEVFVGSTSSGRLELHAVAGPAFTSTLANVATNLQPGVPGSDTVTIG